MLTPLLAVLVGLVVLSWSADKFIDGAATLARHSGMPPLLIGMVIVGFGTSAPEMTVSALAALEGQPGIALGNAYGSNITNIALILGISTMIRPMPIHSRILRRELPILLLVSLFAASQLLDGRVSRLDALLLILVFGIFMAWSIHAALQTRRDALLPEYRQAAQEHQMPLRQAVPWTVAGLVLLVASSRLLVWGAVEIALSLGVSELVVGLTLVAVGTSLPELASSVIAARKGESDLALGNILGSNFFNTLAVIGLAGLLQPLPVPDGMLARDIPVTLGVTLLLYIVALGGRGKAQLARPEGMLLLGCYVAYTVWLATVAG